MFLLMHECVCVSIDNSLLRPERRLTLLKEALNKQMKETQRWKEEGRERCMGAGECMVASKRKAGRRNEGELKEKCK